MRRPYRHSGECGNRVLLRPFLGPRNVLISQEQRNLLYLYAGAADPRATAYSLCAVPRADLWSASRGKSMFRPMLVALGAAAIAYAVPAVAQEYPLEGGNYWNVAEVTIDDGHF